MVSTKKICIARVAKSLMPKQTFGTRVEFVQAEFLEWTGGRIKGVFKQCMNTSFSRAGCERVGVTSRVPWKKNGGRVTEAMIERAVKTNVFRATKLVVKDESIDAGEWEFVKRRASELRRLNKFFKRPRRKDDRTDARTVIAEDGNISLRGGCRDTKNTIPNGDVFVAISGDEANATGFGSGEFLIVM